MMTVNGKSYTIPEITFNTMCDLETNGVSLEKIGQKPLATIRGFLCVAMGQTLETAGRELEEHLKNGGSFEEIIGAISQAINDSGFFKALATNKKTGKEKPAESKK